MKQHKIEIVLTALSLLCLLLMPAISVGAGDESAIGSEKQVVAEVGEDGVQRVEIIGGEYYFDPNHIVVQINKPVELLVRKVGGFVPHNIIVKAPEAGIDINVEMDKVFKPISFTPSKVGRYPMYCDKRFLWFETHQAKGMEGIIEVVE